MGTERDTRKMSFVEQLDAPGGRSDISSVNHQQVTRIDASNWACAVLRCSRANEYVKARRTIRTRLDQFCYAQSHRVVTAQLGANGE